MSRRFRSVTMASRCRRKRPSRSNFQTTSTSPDRRSGQAGFQPRPVVAGAGRLVLVQIAAVHAGGGQGVALEIDGLAVIGGGDAHVADKHVRETQIHGCRTLVRSDRICRAEKAGAGGRGRGLAGD